ncbi:MAG: ATP-binding protein [Deltaproteobacteria bacterium]|nr:ATP-binding protein [Deltaproteobacteria bacterium]
MAPAATITQKPVEHGRGFRRIVTLLVSLVTVPTALLLAVGVLMLVFYSERLNLLFGILVVSLVVCLATGSILALIFLRREARISELQQDFVSKVSHELRTPLTSIRIFVETIQRGEIPAAELSECHDALALEVGKLTARIERLLDWGRMEAGKRVYELKSVPVGRIVERSLDAFDTATLGRRVEVEVEVEEGLPTVLADGDALVDALVNLLANAYKYTTEERQIALRASREGPWVKLSVRDNGIGIPHREHRRIFQKFYRVDERLTQAKEGTGLGLAIVQHVVSGHRGRLTLESEPGQGSTFSLLLHPAAPETRA